MGIKESRHEKMLEKLPLVKGKFEIISQLGDGNIGGICKVVNKKSKKVYVLKFVPIERDPSNKKVSDSEVKRVYESATREIITLQTIKNTNVVRFFDSFVLNDSPLSKIQKKSHKCHHICLLMEYCHGITLQSFLKTKYEERIKLKEEEMKFRKPDATTKADKPLIRQDVAIFWFINLLETLDYIHTMQQIHGDLNLKNLLLCFPRSDPKKEDENNKIRIKITGFGSSSTLSEDGEILYKPPEQILETGRYDNLADIWSLGIIFLQIYGGISLDVMNRYIEQIFKKIWSTSELKQTFCERYGKHHLLDRKHLIKFIYEQEMFYEIIEEFVEDEGVRNVLSQMICPPSQRQIAAELLTMPCVQTWRYLMEREGKSKIEDFDLLGLLTIMQIPFGENDLLFSKCVEVLKDRIFDEYDRFVENGGIKIMFGWLWKVKEISRREKHLKDVIQVLVMILCELKLVCSDDDEEDNPFQKSMREIISCFRQTGCFQTLEKILIDDVTTTTVKNDDFECIIYFTLMMVRYSQTMRCEICKNQEIIQNLINNKLMSGKINEIYIKAIFHTLVPHMNSDQLQQFLSTYPGSKNDLTFMKKCRHREVCFDKVIHRLFLRIREIIGKSETGEEEGNPNNSDKGKNVNISMGDGEDNEEEKEIVGLLGNVIFQVQEFDLTYKVHPLKLRFESHRIPSETRMEIARSNVDDWKSVDIQPLHISCRTKSKKMIELLSQNPLFVFNYDPNMDDDGEVEICVSYYEIDVENGGFTDDLYYGFRILKIKPSQVLLHAAKGIVSVVDFTNKTVRQKRIPPIFCESNTTIGCGMTNKGRVFFTKDNRIHGDEFMNVFPPSSENSIHKIPVNVSIKFSGNFGFKGYLNFGRVGFKFKFKETVPEIQVTKEEKKTMRLMKKVGVVNKWRGVNKKAVECIKQHEDPGGYLREKVKKKYKDDGIVHSLLEKISSLEKHFKEHDFDDDLQEMYNEDEIFQIVDLEFENSRSKKVKERTIEEVAAVEEEEVNRKNVKISKNIRVNKIIDDPVVTPKLEKLKSRSERRSDSVVNNRKGLKLKNKFKKYKGMDVRGIIRIWKVLRKKMDPQRLVEEKTGLLYHAAKGMRSICHKKAGSFHPSFQWDSVRVYSNGEVGIITDTKESSRRSSRKLPKVYVPEIIAAGKDPSKTNVSTNIYDFGMLMYCLLWEVYDPYLSRMDVPCVCGKEIVESRDLDRHIVHCNLRPFLDEKNVQKFPVYLIEMMEDCWKRDPFVRPSFEDICSRFEIFEQQNSQKKKKQLHGTNYNYVVKVIFRFPKFSNELGIKDQVVYLPESKFCMKVILGWLEKKFKPCKVVRLSYYYSLLLGVTLKKDSDLENLLVKKKSKMVEGSDGDDYTTKIISIQLSVDFDGFREKQKKHFRKYREDNRSEEIEKQENEEENEGEEDDDDDEEEEMDISELISGMRDLFEKKKRIGEDEATKIRDFLEDMIRKKMKR